MFKMCAQGIDVDCASEGYEQEEREDDRETGEKRRRRRVSITIDILSSIGYFAS